MRKIDGYLSTLHSCKCMMIWNKKVSYLKLLATFSSIKPMCPIFLTPSKNYIFKRPCMMVAPPCFFSHHRLFKSLVLAMKTCQMLIVTADMSKRNIFWLNLSLGIHIWRLALVYTVILLCCNFCQYYIVCTL